MKDTKIGQIFTKGPRSVDDIMAGFTKTIDELNQRIEQDAADVQENNLRISELQRENLESEASKASATNFRDRLKEMLGLGQ